jgi:hypothetical protein
MVPNRLALVLQYAASVFDRQLHLNELVGELDWNVDLTAGILSFGDRYRWSVQLLGTESEANRTWLWAWANPGDLGPDLLRAALALQAFGQKHALPEFASPQLSLNTVDGHLLGMIATGMLNAHAYYRAPYEGGAAILLITDEAFPRCPDPPLSRIAEVFPQAIAAFPLPDHKRALEGYLQYYGLACADEYGRIVVREGGEPVLIASFDAQNRLSELHVTHGGEGEPEPR